MTKPRILVTGATGKTGRVVVNELLKTGGSSPLGMFGRKSASGHGPKLCGLCSCYTASASSD